MNIARAARGIRHLIAPLLVACLVLVILSISDSRGTGVDHSGLNPDPSSPVTCISSLAEDEVVIQFSHPDVVDGSYGFELNATISNVTAEMTVTLHLNHVTSRVLRNYTMADFGLGVFVAAVPGPMNTGSHYVWVSVCRWDSEIATSTVTPMTVVDWTRPTIWSHGLRFEGEMAVFWINCSDAYSVDQVSLMFPTDGPDPANMPSRRFSLVNGTVFNGSWEYRTELDSESYFQYMIFVSDSQLGISTGNIFYNREAALEEVFWTAVIVITVLLVAVVAIILLVVKVFNRTRTL